MRWEQEPVAAHEFRKVRITDFHGLPLTQNWTADRVLVRCWAPGFGACDGCAEKGTVARTIRSFLGAFAFEFLLLKNASLTEYF
jgi:hypothetical protein